MKGKIIAALAAAPAIAILAAAAPATASMLPAGSAHAATYFTGVPDSGYNGNWATDDFADFSGVTPVKGDCPSGAPYSYAGTDTDFGSSYTIKGDESPGETAVTIRRTVQVTMAGGFTGITFCSSSGDAQASGVPLFGGSVLAGNLGTSAWFAQFFPKGTVITGFSDPGWSWTYTLDQNPCGGRGFQKWTDGSTVPQASSGNILVEDCPR